MPNYPSNLKTSRGQVAIKELFVDGKRPWDIRVHDGRFYSHVWTDGMIGFGESYMDGWWDCEAIDEMCFRAIRARLHKHISFNIRTIISMILSRCLNLQSKYRARLVGKHHYDLGNNFFEAMLDPTLQYSCAYFLDNRELTEPQKAKMDLICRN